ncbi:GNAT family N-acetyltransferase [uncultured Mucilaginibacter sp.]|uniref:GNAT family N-acetyltransferase n=1 Tax=uncultured Mucilaginibacter sp. TaxID=797541 RepID=UPI0025FF859E|nr:GNAT family N-acetyltransferase [uncultured Mucilaginibacter sp.]
MDLKLVRSGSDSPDFKALVALLDKELDERYGAQQEFFGQFNSLAQIKQVVVAYADDVPAGCGAIKEYEAATTEVKRMFVKPGFRGKGIAAAISAELEKRAKESGYSHTILQTGLNQPEAVALYAKAGYWHIENYGQYAGTDDSICMKKKL